MSSEFAVWLFFPDASCDRAGEALDAQTAVLMAQDYSTRPAAIAGFIRRIVITDGGDHTCFEWRFGEGVTFPPSGPRRDPELAA